MVEKKVRIVAPKIQVTTADWYSTNFRSLNSGVTFALEVFPILYWQAISEMKGIFSTGELCMILDVMNGYSPDVYTLAPGLCGQHITLSIVDSFNIYPNVYEKKWNIPDKNDFLRRINSLTRFSKFALEIWASIFWTHHDVLDVDEYVKYMAGEEETIDLTPGKAFDE